MVKKFVFGLSLGILGLSLLGIGYFIGHLDRATSGSENHGYPLLEEAQNLITDNYFGEIPELLVLQRGMIHGMIAKLGDQFTTYVEPVANELQADDLMGRFGGIGAHLTRDDDGFIHVVAYPDGPAAEANIREEFLLIGVDGVSITPATSFDEIVSMIRGDIGTSVTLTFQIVEPAELRDITLIRVEFDIPSVTSYQLPSNEQIGVIIIHRFSDRTTEEVEEAYDRLVIDGIGGLLIDLRANTGGILDTAIEVAKFFLDNGIILIQAERDGEVEEYTVSRPGDGFDIPLVVLIDSGTASASEVLAAALGENDRAQLVGEQSYGKGSVQSVISLSDGSSLHITIARWLTPSHSSIDGVGLIPDVPVQRSNSEQDEILDVGVSLLLDLIKE
jgi:carboxyl-terminal processing protease